MDKIYIALAEGCTEVDKSEGSAVTVVGTFYDPAAAKLECENFARCECDGKLNPWDDGIDYFLTSTECGETVFTIRLIK